MPAVGSTVPLPLVASGDQLIGWLFTLESGRSRARARAIRELVQDGRVVSALCGALASSHTAVRQKAAVAWVNLPAAVALRQQAGDEVYANDTFTKLSLAIRDWLAHDEEARGQLLRTGQDVTESAKRTTEQIVEEYRQVAASFDTQREKQFADFQRHFNEYAQTLPQATIDEKRATERVLNGELAPRGLAAKCPNTNCASYLYVTPAGDPKVGRFQFGHIVEGKTVITATRNLLPELNIVLAETCLAPSTHDGTWAEFVNRQSSGVPKKAGGKS